MISHYIKLAMRNLWANKLFSTINITGLAIGMAATFLIYIWVKNEWTYDNYHKDSDRIYRVFSHAKWAKESEYWPNIPSVLAQHAVEEIPEIISASVMKSVNKGLIKVENHSFLQQEQFIYVDSAFFDLFNFDILYGDVHSFHQKVFSIGLSKQLAKKYFGRENVIGEILTLDTVQYSVELILDDNRPNSIFQFDAFIPLQAHLKNNRNEHYAENWNYFGYTTFVKLVEGTDEKQIGEKISEIYLKRGYEKNEETSFRFQFVLEPLHAIHFSEVNNHSLFKFQNQATVYTFAIIGLLLLLTASWNYLNLSIALINKRIKEIGLKKIVGASFGHIFVQMLLEALLISGFSILLAMGVVQLCLPLLNQMTDANLNLSFGQPYFWFGLAIMLILNMGVAGIYPAYLFAGLSPIHLIQIKSHDLRPHTLSFRKIFIVAQFAVSIIIGVSTMVIHYQLSYIREKDLGFDRDLVLSIMPKQFDQAWRKHLPQFTLYEEQLRQIPEFKAVSVMSNPPLDIGDYMESREIEWEGKDPDYAKRTYYIRTDEYLLSTLQLSMVEGRWFFKDELLSSSHIMLNEAAVRSYQLKEPIIGSRINVKGNPCQIVGIIKDFHFDHFRVKIQPLIISPQKRDNIDYESVILAKIHPSNVDQAVEKARSAFKQLFPGLPFQYDFLDGTYMDKYQSERQLGLIFKCFSGMLLLISCLGLFGLSTFMVERRTKEIGIRKVLGASISSIVRLLSKEFLLLVFISFLIAVPISWYFMKGWLENFAYRISLEAWVFMGVGVLVLFIAFLTISIHSIKAAIANPIDALRNE